MSVRQHGFDKMPAATRSVAVELHEHAEQITLWRDSLPAHHRKRLIHALSVTRRWRASTAHGNGRSLLPDLRRDAGPRLVSAPAVGALPPDAKRAIVANGSGGKHQRHYVDNRGKHARPGLLSAAGSDFPPRDAGVPPETTAFLQSVLSSPRQREALRTDPHFLQQFRARLARLCVRHKSNRAHQCRVDYRHLVLRDAHLREERETPAVA